MMELYQPTNGGSLELKARKPRNRPFDAIVDILTEKLRYEVLEKEVDAAP
jgi:hypothetical protein